MPFDSGMVLKQVIRIGIFAGIMAAQAQEPAASLGQLKHMSIDELLGLEVTTVSRGESTVGQSPAAIYVITREDIRRSGASVIPELFRAVPGMDVARIDNNKWAVGVRGFNDRFNGKLLVQVDGRSVYNPLSSGVYWDAVDYPLEDIERIEIIRGPGASVWGANAVNGVINIITRSAAETQGSLLDVGGGIEERGFGTFRYGGKLRDTDYRVYAKAYSRDRQFSLSGDAPDEWTGGSGGFRLDRAMNARDQFTLQGDFLHSDAQRRDFRPQPAAPYSLVNTEEERTRGGNLLARYTRQLREGSSWSLQAYWDHFDRDGTQGYVDLRWDTFDLDFQHQLPIWSGHAVIYGAGYRYIDAHLGASTQDNGFAVSFTPAARHPQLFTAFLQDQITLQPGRWSLTLGSKFEHNEHTGFELQPSARLLWTPASSRSAWAAVSRALRTPNLSEDAIGSRQLPSFPVALGGAPLFGRLTDSPDFESEELVAYELGYREQISTALSLDAAVFYNDYDSLRVVVPGARVPGAFPGSFDLPLTFQNRMSGATYGAELSASWQAANSWRVYGAYTFLRMNLRADASLPAGVIASAEAPERQNPRQQFYLQSSWNLPKDLEVDLSGRYVDHLTAYSPIVPAYVAIDARLGWRPTNDLELTLVGRNLLDDHHPESGTAPLLSSLLVEIERSVYVMARFHW